MAYATLDAFYAHLEEMGRYDAAYWDRMMHAVPVAPSVDRVAWLTEYCRGKTVLHLGCEGPLHALLRPVCTRLYGVDQVAKREAAYFQVDLNWAPDELPVLDDVERILAGEVLEHCVNVGFLLRILQTQYPAAELVVTVPNAFCPQPKLKDGWECVNPDHIAWYSYWTLKTLLEKCGYAPQQWLWYNGKPRVAEGLIMTARGGGPRV